MKVQLKLHLYIEGIPERTITVNKDEFIIGRQPHCDLCLPFAEISRQHSCIRYTESDNWVLEDFASTNGTLLNQFRVKAPQILDHHDVIQVGNVLLGVILVFAEPVRSNLEGKNQSRIILRKADELQEQWIDGNDLMDTFANNQVAIARLKHLVEIAKGLNSVQSLDGIFEQVKEVAFQEIQSIDRLGLLVDINNSGKLKLLKASAKYQSYRETLVRDISWISPKICRKVFIEKVAIKSIDHPNDVTFQSVGGLLMEGVRGALAVPLWDRNRVIGVLYADARLPVQDSEPLEDEELSFFSTLANLVGSSVQRWLLSYQLQQEEQIRHKLERYHSPAVVQQLITARALDNGRLTPIESNITILFADLVGFTALSERLSPREIADLLNRLFEEMLDSVFKTGGTLDKFIGDCIMAFFGAPEPQPDHPDRALAAALGMLNRLDELNQRGIWPEPLQLRIGINTGKAVVGDVGSAQRVDYTVLGATVNLASRMESICPPGEIVISEATYKRLKYRQGFSRMGLGKFKGISKPVKIYQTHRKN
jgi:class 3 adenylate cyclase/pSer/pThr/pTyr-binding forkhead associated (FHA) protein